MTSRHSSERSGKIIVRLLGGLGNQMFQYALGRSMSLRHDVPLMLDLSLLMDWRPGYHATNRAYDLDIFDLPVEFASRTDVARYHPHGAGFPGKLWFHLRKRLVGERVVDERQFNFDSTVFELEPPAYLAGTWQSYRYFSDIEDTLREDFRFRDALPDSAKRIASGIASPYSVCVHVRRGDYVSNPSNAETIGFAGVDYYRRAVDEMRRTIAWPKFFVFSDDLPWCEEKMAWLGDDTVFVRCAVPAGTRAHACDMQAMCQAQNFIISNSTFAWWSAWLAGPRARKVIAPKNWFRSPHLNADDLVPDQWERL